MKPVSDVLHFFSYIVANIAVVKPQKAEQLSNLLLQVYIKVTIDQNASRGHVQGQVTEDMLIDLLEQVSEKEKTVEPKITVRKLK